MTQCNIKNAPPDTYIYVFHRSVESWADCVFFSKTVEKFWRPFLSAYSPSKSSFNSSILAETSSHTDPLPLPFGWKSKYYRFNQWHPKFWINCDLLSLFLGKFIVNLGYFTYMNNIDDTKDPEEAIPNHGFVAPCNHHHHLYKLMAPDLLMYLVKKSQHTTLYELYVHHHHCYHICCVSISVTLVSRVILLNQSLHQRKQHSYSIHIWIILCEHILTYVWCVAILEQLM